MCTFVLQAFEDFVVDHTRDGRYAGSDLWKLMKLMAVSSTLGLRELRKESLRKSLGRLLHRYATAWHVLYTCPKADADGSKNGYPFEEYSELFKAVLIAYHHQYRNCCSVQTKEAYIDVIFNHLNFD